MSPEEVRLELVKLLYRSTYSSDDVVGRCKPLEKYILESDDDKKDADPAQGKKSKRTGNVDPLS